MPPAGLAPIVPVAPSQPEDHVLQRALEVLRGGGVVVLPTDTLYGIACAFANPQGVARIATMRNFDPNRRPLAFLLPDIGELPKFAKVNDAALSVLRKIFPGPYCAEVNAGPLVPGPFLHDDLRTIGVRVPGTALCEKITWSLGMPLLSATAKSPSGDLLTGAAEIRREYGRSVDLILDAGELSGPPATVVSFAGDKIVVLREGRGPRILTEG